MKILNDQIIVSDLQSNGLWGSEYNYYIYAYMLPSSNAFGLGAIAVLATKYYILNFNEQGLGVLGINLEGSVIEGHVQMLPYIKIKQLSIKSKLVTLGMAVNLQIILDDNTTLNMQVNRYVATIKQQGPNLQSIRSNFANGIPRSAQADTSVEALAQPNIISSISTNQTPTDNQTVNSEEIVNPSTVQAAIDSQQQLNPLKQEPDNTNPGI